VVGPGKKVVCQTKMEGAVGGNAVGGAEPGSTKRGTEVRVNQRAHKTRPTKQANTQCSSGCNLQ